LRSPFGGVIPGAHFAFALVTTPLRAARQSLITSA
jgi:hypothetical protein